MITRKNYDRENAIIYASRWAFDRNPLFFNFTGQGGNCTNFVSQCLLAGCCQQDPTQTFGWYYKNVDDRAPAWTGVNEFYDFITGKGDFPPKISRLGPYGSEVTRESVDIGDAIQLANEEGVFYHTLLVTAFFEGDILVAAQSDDAFDRPLSSYNYAAARFIHIEGINIELSENSSCFENLINGSSLPPSNVIYIPSTGEA